MNKILQSTRKLFTSNTNNKSSSIVSSIMLNRNPRNLEKLRIARKPTGYHLDKPGKTFWHKITITQKSRYVVATVSHNNGKVVVQASTNELGINKHLYRCNDKNAYINLANVLAERCLQSGIMEMINGVDVTSSKAKSFIEYFKNAGVSLSEPTNYTPMTPWSRTIHEKPWKIHVE